MAGVRVSAQLLKMQIQMLTQAGEAMETARNAILAQYQQLGSHWNDEKYRALGAIVNESAGAMRKAGVTYLRGAKSLAALYSAASEYENASITAGGGGGAPGGAAAVRQAAAAGDRQSQNALIAARMRMDQCARQVDFGGMDPRVSQEIYDTVLETQGRFPKLEMNFVGSMQACCGLMRQHLLEANEPIFRQRNPDLNEEQLRGLLERSVDAVMVQFAPEHQALGQSITVAAGDEAFPAAFTGISFNEDHAADYEQLLARRQEGVDAHWFPEGCVSARSLADHELAHQLSALVRAADDDEMRQLFDQYMANDEQQRWELLCGRAAVSNDIEEFIAEAWAEYCNNPECRPLARAVGERLTLLYDQMVRRDTLRR